MAPRRFPRQPQSSDDTGYLNPVPPGSAGPVPLLSTNSLPLPPLGATSKANAIPPLQKITVQQPQALPMPAMPSLTGHPMGSQALSDAFRYRFMNRIASQMDPASSFENELAAAQQAKTIHDLVYPPTDPQTAAQNALEAENYARYLRGEPPIQIANAQAASDKASKIAQDAADKAQKDEAAAQSAALAKRMNPAAHYLASPEGLQQYSDENGLNLAPEDITRLDEMGRNAASGVVTGQPSAYWNAVGLDTSPSVEGENPQSSSVNMLLQSPRFAQAYGGAAEGGSTARGLAKNPVDYYPSGTLPGDTQPAPDRSNDVTGVGADASLTSQDIPPILGHFPGYGQGFLGTASAMGPYPNQTDLPLPPGGALPGQPPDLRTQVTHALQGGAVAGITAGAAALIGRRLGIDPIKAGLVAAGLVGAGDVAAEQGWVAPAVNAVGSLFSAPQRALQAQLSGEVAPAQNPPGTTTYSSDLSPLIDAVSGAFAKTDPSQPFLQRLDSALTLAASPFEQSKEALTAPLGTIPYVGAPAQGVANTAIDLASNPVMWDPAMWGGAAIKGAAGLGAANYARSALTGGTPAEQTRAVEEGANIGLMAGPAVEGVIKLIRQFVTKPTLLSEAAVAAEPVAPTAAEPVPAAGEAPSAPTGRPLEAIQSDLQKANDEWSQFRAQNPTMPLAEQVQHPAAQRIAALADERDAALNPAVAPVEAPVTPEAVTPAAGAVAPEVAPATSPTATAPLLHPVTGANMATGDLVHDTEVKLALDELHAAGDDAKAAKKGPAIKKAAKRMQAAAEAFVGPNDPAGAQAIIDAEMGRAATPVVAPVAETAVAAPSAMDDLLAEQAARVPVQAEVAPPLATTPPVEPVPVAQPEVVPPVAETTVAPIEPTPVPQGKPLEGPVGNETTAAGADPNTSYAMRYRVVPLDDLIASNTDTLAANPEYANELQPRDRGRAASRTQIDKIAQTLNPDALLNDSGQLDRGPMIVGPDSMVESGNGRVLALRTARTSAPERFTAYVDQLKQMAPSLGIDATQLEGIKDPVLVRERTTPVDRASFAAEANASSVLGMSTGEQAAQDASRLSGASVGRIWVGSDMSLDQALQATANRPVQRDFITSMPENERATLVDAEGNLNKVGLERLKAAVFARTYPGEAGQRLTTAFFESLDPTVQTVKQAIYANLPSMARAVGMMQTGVRDVSLNAADDIAAAIDVFARLKQDGLRVDDYLAQTSMFDRELTPMQEQVLSFLGENGRSSKRVREFLDGYTSGVEKAPPPQQMGLFDNVQPTKEGLIDNAIAQIQRNQENTGLFAVRGTGAAEETPPAAVAENGTQLAGGTPGGTVELHAGISPKELVQSADAVRKWALKNPGKTVIGSVVAFTAIGAFNRAQQQTRTGQPDPEFASDPRINYLATFGGGVIQPRDFMEGSGIYADHVVLPAAEWALETIDVVPWGIAKLLGSDPSKTKGGIFNTDHTLAWVGDAFGGPTDPVSNLYDGLKQRSQEYKIDQPLASFVLSLPFDPLNWLGWGVAEKSAPNVAKALFETSPEGIAARIARLENPNFGQVPRLASGNRLEDTFFAMTAGPRALWNWTGQLSRASRATQLADEHARLAVAIAGSPTVRASSFLEDVAAKMVRGTASGDEMKIAHIIAKPPPVDENAVRHLAEDLGHRLDPNETIDPDLIDEISKRVQSKHAWTADDVGWLKDQFDSLRPLENKIQQNVVDWHQNLNGAPATMTDFEQLRRLFHIDPRVTFSTGMGVGRPEVLKSTLETVNQLIKDRPLLRGDGSLNTLRPSEVSFIGKMLGRKGWGLTQDTRINAWAAKYGLPDLGPAIERSKGLSMQDFSGIVSSAVRRNFPPDESALRGWMEAHPFALGMLDMWDNTGPARAGLDKRLFTPLKLSFLTSFGFPVHIARTLSMRNPELSLQAAGSVLGAGRGIVGVVKEAVQTGFGTSSYRAAKGLPQGPGFVAPVLVRGVKSELGNLAFWHNADLISEAYLGDYGRSFLYGGHSSMMGLPADTNPVSEGFLVGRWFFGLNMGDRLKAEAARRTLDLSRERASLAMAGKMTVEEAAKVPVNAITALIGAGADVVHNANIGSVFGVTSHSVAQMEQGFRMGFVAWQHPIVYKQVLSTLDENARLAQAALDRIAVRPAGLTDDAWKRVRSLFELKGSSGKLQQLVGTALDGTIDRNAFAQAAFQEPDLPEFAKSELWGVLNRASPAELTTIFARGGYADQMLEKVLQQTYSGRVTEALNQTVAELTPKLEPLRAQIKDVEKAQRVYRKAGEFSQELLNQHTRLSTQRDNLITESWKSIEGVLNDQMQVHHRLWEWAYDAKRYVPEGQKDQFFANIQNMRQKLIADGQTEASDAMQMWRQQVLRQGIPIPKDIIQSYDNIFQHIQGAFAESDHATQEAWAFTRSHKGPGSQAEVSAKWHEVWQQNDATWNNYRAFRDGEQEKIFARLKQYYTAKKGLSVADKAEAAQEILPRVVPPVPEDVRIRAQAALERIRGVADNFVKQPPMPEDQVQIIRDAAARVDQAAAQLPQSQLDAIKHAHLATANLVMQDGNKRFLNYQTRSNFDQVMTKTLFPFWQYDRHGGAFYSWMLTHIPGSAESYAREIMDTKDNPQGAGYFPTPGGGGIFGNEISPNRGLWDYRVKAMANFFLQNRPDGLKSEFQQAFSRVLTEGFMGAHVSPALSFPIEAALGSNVSDMSLPPLIATGQDVATQITGQPYQTDQFARRAVADQLVAMQADPYHPTPDQYETAVKQAAMQDMAGNTMPMFTDVLPERIAQRADFAKALTDYGFSPAAQQKWQQLHPGQSLFAMLNKEQGAKLMDDHPGWKYLFEASTASLPPEELQKRIEISDQFEQLHQLTQARLDDQAKFDAQVLGSKDKPATISPSQWMDLRGSRMDRYLGAKDQLTGGTVWQSIQATLDDPERIKLLKPEDQAKIEYYALQANLIKKNTDDLGKINWEEVTQGTDAMLNGLTPFQQSYVRNELVKNQTPVERTWHNALSEKTKLDVIPAWIGISPDVAIKKQAAMTALNKLLSLRGPGNAEKAAAFERQNRALLHAGRPNPARIRWMLQPENADYRFWFARASTKNSVASSSLDPSELAPWEYSPTVTGPLVAPDLNAAPDLAAAGG